MIKAVIFDIDGTLYDYESCNRVAMEALTRYCGEKLQVDASTVLSAHKEANRRATVRIGYTCASIHNRLIRYQCMLELLGQPLFPHAVNLCDLYWGTMLEEMKPFEGLLEWMERLKGQGTAIGIGSNMTAYIQYKKLEKLGAVPYIDWIVTSEEAGVEKPDPKLFLLCLEKSGVAPGECLFVGDSLACDMAGAVDAGMRGLLFDPELSRKGQKAENCRVIRSYKECLTPGFLETF